jgi:threonyl-tRNA synthetase
MTETTMDSLDHRQIGQRLGLFHMQEEASGMVFWHPRGLTLVGAVEDAIRRQNRNDGFEEVRTPQLVRQSIWASSGHWENFRQHMYAFGSGGREEALKPVNCPCHVQIVERMAPSYRDLPIRLSEFGILHRAEDSGALNGLFRLRQFTQDDGHVFCSEENIEEEVRRFCVSLDAFYRAFGFAAPSISFSTRPSQKAGDDALWDRAEAALMAAARGAGLDPTVNPGEGAFYGPKLDFALRDAHGRSWQCGTVQLDFVMPGRFGLAYIDAGGARVVPVMVHRAILGSVERFIAILLEHYEGAMPPWLAPDQIAVLPVGEAQEAAAMAIASRLRAVGLRARARVRSVTLARAIVDTHQDGVPIVAIVGRREVVSDAVTIRARDGSQVTLGTDEAVAHVARQCAPPL